MGTVLVTGANRGIGLELCRQLKDRGDEVIATCRRSSDELDGLGVRILSGVDVSDDDSVSALAEAVGDTNLDALYNNAGILSVETLSPLDFEGIRRQFEINSLGPLRVTQALLPRLPQGSKVVIMTSLMGSISDNGSGRYYGYRMSKAAVNMAGVCLAHDLRSRGIAVFLMHPGMVATEMTGGRGIPVTESVEGILKRVDHLGLEQTGTFWHSDGRSLPW